MFGFFSRPGKSVRRARRHARGGVFRPVVEALGGGPPPGGRRADVRPEAEQLEERRLLSSSFGGGQQYPTGDSRLALDAGAQPMQETQMSFNLQSLQLQSQMQSDNRVYTALSNIMKTKHDTVVNSIGNVR